MSLSYRVPRQLLALKTAPAALPVTRDECKSQARVELTDDEENSSFDIWLQAAVDHLDPSGQGWLGAAIMSQVWQLKLDRFPCSYDGRIAGITLAYPPLISVDSITYYDMAGVLQTLVADTDYQISGIGAWQKAIVAPAPGALWPSTQFNRLDAVVVEFTCGHAAAANVPASIKQAILMTVAHYYRNRETAFIGSHGIAELPWGAQALLGPLRVCY
jgi:uncharacterized phiE125 gp8 family phage protein